MEKGREDGNCGIRLRKCRAKLEKTTGVGRNEMGYGTEYLVHAI